MTGVIQAHLRKLNTPSVFLQRQLVAAVFQALSKDSNAGVDAIRDLVSACLSHDSPAVVEETVDGLALLTGQRQDVKGHALDMLLASLASVRADAAAVVAKGLVDMFVLLSKTDGPEFPESQAAHSHPLVTAWFSTPTAPAHLLACLSTHMANAAANTKALLELFAVTRPFLVYVMLVGPELGCSRTAGWDLAGAELWLRLVQWGFTHPCLTLPITRLLLYCLQHCPVAPHPAGATLLQCLPTIMDLLELVCDHEEHSKQDLKMPACNLPHLSYSDFHHQCSSQPRTQPFAGSTATSIAPSTPPSIAPSSAPSIATSVAASVVAPQETAMVSDFAEALLRLCRHLAAAGMPLTQPLACLLRLKQLPGGHVALAMQLLPLAELSVDAREAEFDVLAVLMLVGLKRSCMPLTDTKQPQQPQQPLPQAPLPGSLEVIPAGVHGADTVHVGHMLLFLVLPRLGLSTNSQSKLWCTHLLAALQQWERSCRTGFPTRLSAGAVSSSPAADLSGKSTGRGTSMVQLAEWVGRVLGSSGSAPLRNDLPEWLRSWQGAATEWLDSFQHCLHYTQSSSSTGPTSETSRAHTDSLASSPISSCTCMALSALLSHSSASIQISAAAALRQLVLHQPLIGLPFLPLVLYLLGRSSSPSMSTSQAPNSTSSSTFAVLHAAKQQAMLHVLPAMAADNAMAGYAQRALQPLTSASSPPVAYTGGLRLVVDMWALTGKGWNRVEDVLVGYVDPKGEKPPLSLRLARAGLVLQVTQSDTSKGLQLVPAVQQCATDPEPAIAALGLEALGVLCRDDTLDFYKAFTVLHKWHPRLPGHPLLAAKWVGLMGRGALDAEAYPDRATAIVELLWSLVEHPADQVRAAAYSALYAYPLELLEKLEAAADLVNYVTPCLSEHSPSACHAAEELAVLALEHEHQHRRRFLLLAAQPTDTSGMSSSKEVSILTHRLAYTLPRLLCPASRLDVPPARRAVTPHSGPYLLLQHLSLVSAAAPKQQQGPDKVRKDTAGNDEAGTVKADDGRAGHDKAANDKAGNVLGTQQEGMAPAGQQGLQETMQHALHSLQWNRWTHPWLALHSWHNFFLQWQAHPSSGGLVWALETLEQLWQHGNAAEEANCCLAAAGLCSAVTEGTRSCSQLGSGSSHSLTSTLLNKLHEKALEARSSSVQKAALVAAAYVATSMEPCDAQAWESTLQLLQKLLGEGGSVSMETLGVSADAAAYLCCELLDMEDGAAGIGLVPVLHASTRLLSLLLGLLGLLWPQHLAALLDLALSAPTDWNIATPEVPGVVSEQLLQDEDGQCIVLPHVVKAVVALLVQLQHVTEKGAHTAQMFMDVVCDELRLASSWVSSAATGATQSSVPAPLSRQQAAAAAAAIEALPPLLLSGWRAQWLAEGGLHSCLRQLRVVISSSSVDGLVRGAAATAMGQLLFGILHDSTSLPQELVSDVQQLFSLLGTPSKQPHGSISRCGAAAALAVLLGGQPMWQTNMALGGQSRSVAAVLSGAGVARKALKALEAAALSETDPRVSATASWLLAGVCAAASKALQSSSPGAASEQTRAAPDLKPLAAYPATGAVKPLAEALLNSSKRSELGTHSVTCVLRSLARCPRLPSANWGGLVRQLLRPVQPSEEGAEQQLQVAVAKFLLAHAHVPQFGLAVILDELFLPAKFARLKPAVQELLAEHLDRLPACLPSSRSAVLLKSLAALLALLPPPSKAKVGQRLWRGVAKAATAAAQHKFPFQDGHLLLALKSGVLGLLAVLPTPMQMLPGHILQIAAAVNTGGHLQSKPAVHPQAAYNCPIPFVHPCEASLQLWAAATHALSQMEPQWALSATDTRGAPSVQRAACTCFLRALLVLGGCCSSRELLGCQSWLMNLESKSQRLACVDTAMVAVSLGLSTAEPRVQVQSFLDIIHACKVCSHPGMALRLACCMSAACQWRSRYSAAADACFTLICPDAAVAVLPYVMNAVMGSSVGWAGQADAVCIALLDVLQSGRCSDYLRVQVQHSLVEMRQAMSHAAWRQVVDVLAEGGAKEEGQEDFV